MRPASKLQLPHEIPFEIATAKIFGSKFQLEIKSIERKQMSVRVKGLIGFEEHAA